MVEGDAALVHKFQEPTKTIYVHQIALPFLSGISIQAQPRKQNEPWGAEKSYHLEMYFVVYGRGPSSYHSIVYTVSEQDLGKKEESHISPLLFDLLNRCLLHFLNFIAPFTRSIVTYLSLSYTIFPANNKHKFI